MAGFCRDSHICSYYVIISIKYYVTLYKLEVKRAERACIIVNAKILMQYILEIMLASY